MNTEVEELLAAHRVKVRPLEVGGVSTVVLEEGSRDAPPVVCLHGVPASSYLYRKVVGELAGRDLRGIAFDLPGLGLAGRPAEFDYSWTGLGAFAVQAVDALGLDRFHLVVHDVGGPVGFELAAAVPERVASLTILNTMVAVETFRRPWVMEPFAHRGLGELWLASMRPRLFAGLMRRIGIYRQDRVTDAELAAYVPLLRGDDAGRAFLRIMRGFERTAQKERLYRSVVADPRRPVQVLWGSRDPALRLARQGLEAGAIAGVPVHTVEGRHFLQEDNAPEIADAIRLLVTGAG